MENGGVTAVSPRSFNEAQKLAHFGFGWLDARYAVPLTN